MLLHSCHGWRQDMDAEGSKWASSTTATATEIQGTCIPFPAEGVVRDFCSHSLVNSRQILLLLPALAQTGKKILSQPIPGVWGALLSFLRISRFQQNFLSHLSMFLQLKLFFTSQLSTSGIWFQFIEKEKKKTHPANRKIQNPQSG